MDKLRTTMLITFDFNPETGEYTPVSSEIVKEPKTTTKKADTIINNSDNPGIIREDGRLILSPSTIDLLGAEEGDRLEINYDKVGTKFKPFIKVSDSEKGNKLAKNGTLSYRGKNNIELAIYGTNFKLEEGKHPNSFYLVDNNHIVKEIPVPENIRVDEDDISDDLPFLTDLDDTQATQITSFTYDDFDLQ